MRGLHRFYMFLPALCAVLPSMAAAQGVASEQDGLGIELEELLSDKGTFVLEFGGTFNASRQKGVGGQYQTIQTGTGEFVSVPIDVGSTDRRADTVLATVGLRNGLSAKSEIYSRAALRHDNSRFTNNATSETESLSESTLQNLVVGINHRFEDRGARPGLIGFADVAVLQNTAASGTNF
jgi:hypothetical protein